MQKGEPGKFQSPLIDEIPDENNSDYSCAWFLEWFHLIVIDHTKASFEECLKIMFNGDDQPAVLEKAIFYAKMWRFRWHLFFRKLWNNPVIQQLFDDDIPQATKVLGAKNGFEYIIGVISEHIYEKLFYGCFNLPKVNINTSAGDIRTRSNILLLSKEGYFIYFKYIFLKIFSNLELFYLTRTHILNASKTKRYRRNL